MGVQQLVHLMHQLGLDPAEQDVLDVLWLAPRIGQSVPGPAREDDRDGELQPGLAMVIADEPEAERPSADNVRGLRRLPQQRTEMRSETSSAPSLHIVDPAGTGSRQAAAVRAPAAPALSDHLELARALRPLKRKRPSRYLVRIDEEATADQIAEQGLWVPALRPAMVRWLELAIVVDGYQSMSIWRQLIREFRDVLERLGAFSDIRFWILDEVDGDPTRPGLRREGPGSPLRSPGELIDPVGRRIVLVVSDCLGPLWRSGAAQRQLAEWGLSQPVAIVQPLPQRLWAFSHVRIVPAHLRAPRPSAPNTQMSFDSWAQASDQVKGLVPVPVIELSADWFASWSRLVSASGTSGVYSMVMFAGPSDPVLYDWASATLTPADPRVLVQRFRASVSPEAFQLAVYLAATPISLPVIRLVQQAMLHSSQSSQVAEVFLGGLLRRKDHEIGTDPDLVQYEFATDGVRDILLRRLRRTDAVRVLLAVSDFIDVRFGQARDFRALLAGQGVTGEYLVGSDSRPFAVVAERVLRLLGGQYLAPADRLATALDRTGEALVAASAAAPVTSVARSKHRPLACPYCYHAFAEREILFRCSGRARVGQKPCKPQRDEVLEMRMGEVATLLPPVFEPEKSADEAECPLCHQSTRNQVCPCCHSRLPATFRSVEGRLIALAGPSLAGKTAFMTVLIHELRHRSGEVLNASTIGADERTHERFVRDYDSPLYRRSMLFPRTTTAGHDYIQPLVFRFTMDQRARFRRPKELLLSFADGAGEDLISSDKVELMTRYLAAADGVIALVDPLQLPEVRRLVADDAVLPPPIEPDQISAFERITRLLAESSGGDSIEKPVAIVVTKLDAVASLLAPDSVLRSPAEVTPFYDQLDGAAVQVQIKEILTEWGAARLVETVQQYYTASRFFGVSSLGYPPVSANRVAPQGIRPYRVMDPFMYLLSQFSFVSSQ